MKLTKEQLKRMIKEELQGVIRNESQTSMEKTIDQKLSGFGDPSQEPGWGSGRPYAGMSEEELIMKYNDPSSPPSVKMSVWIALEGMGYTEAKLEALLAKTSMKET